MRSSRLCCLLSGIGLLTSSVAANATVYDFSYAFSDTANPSPETITGSFTGTGPITDIIDISNISMSLNGTQLTGPFYAWSYTPTSPNCGAASCYTFGGAVVDSTSAKSNFVFTTAVNSSELAASSYFYVIQPWSNPGPGSMTVAAQFAYGGDPNKYLDAYNGQFVPGNFSVSAVPELSTWSMLIAGFTGIGLFRFGGRRLSKRVSLTA